MKTLSKNILTPIATGLVMLLLGIQCSAQTIWYAMGPHEGNQLAPKGGGNASVAVDTSGTPYVVYSDMGYHGRLTVSKFSNGHWMPVGNRGISDSSTTGHIVVDRSGTPSVAYMELTNYYHPIVKQYNGTAWVALGAPIYPGRINIGSIDLQVDPSGELFIVFQDSLLRCLVMKYAGGSWSPVGVPLIGNGLSTSPHLVLDRTGIPYITYKSASGAVVQKYNGTSWTQLAALPVTDGVALTIDTSGAAVIAGNDQSGFGWPHVWRYTGSSWADISGTQLAPYYLRTSTMITTSSGYIYLPISDAGYNTTVLRYDGANWIPMAGAQYGTSSSCAVDASDNIYRLYDAVQSNPILEEYSGTTWNIVGSEGITGDNYTLYGASAIISDKLGIAYTIYTTGINDHFRPVVAQYTGNSWQPLGNIPTAGSGYGSIVAVDKNNDLYAAYIDSVNNTYLKKYDGTTWADVVPTVPMRFIRDMKTGRSDKLYIGEIDFNDTARIKIASYDGSSWSYQDTGGLLATHVQQFSFDIDRNDNIYLAYIDSPDLTINVLQYNGALWQAIYSLPTAATHVEIHLDTFGTPFLLYSDGIASTMLKYNGGTWSSVGNPGFAPYQSTFALNQSGIPYISYIDSSQRAIILKYNGSTWSDQGLQYFATGSYSGSAIAITPSGSIFSTVYNSETWGYEFDPRSDSLVWPGDADANHLVDNTDLLPIGLAYDSTGPVRAVQGIVWQGDAAIDWTDTFTNYSPTLNFKHADCNGDGIVDANDTLAIIQNFGLVHAKTTGSGAPWRSGIPSLMALLSADTLYAGDTLTVSFILGDSVRPANNIYGLAFTYNFDVNVVDSTFTDMAFPNSWLGNSTDKISISKTFNSSGQIKAAVTRINHTSRSGYGMIAKASFKITTDNISGKDFMYYSNQGFISGITAIDQQGNIIQLNAGADTSQVGFTPNAIREVASESVSMYPNPTHDKVFISTDNLINDVSVTNVTGQQVYHKTVAGTQTLSIDVSALEQDLYFVQIRTNKGTGIGKLSIVR